jgi:serine/threonine protein kinase
VRPPASEAPYGALQSIRLERCEAFERRKGALYEALRCALGDCAIPVTDFFVSEGRYHAVSAFVPTSGETLETVGPVSPERARALLYALACCLMRVHAQGIVHADLKPEHVLLSREGGTERVRLVDFDSGFLESDPPRDPDAIQGDPYYLAPETYLAMEGRPVALTRKADTFAFALVAHRLWTGEAPAVGGRAYPYEAALAGAPIRVSRALPVPVRRLVERSLSAHAGERPDDRLWMRLLAPRPAFPAAAPVANGLSRRLRRNLCTLPREDNGKER